MLEKFRLRSYGYRTPEDAYSAMSRRHKLGSGHELHESEHDAIHKHETALEIERIHGVSPEAIFLTQTSAVLYGWMIKEAWKKAWPDEELPKFFTIDVKHETDVYKMKARKEMNKDVPEKEFLKDYINKPYIRKELKKKIEDMKKILTQANIKGNVIIFDEAFHPDEAEICKPDGGYGPTFLSSTPGRPTKGTSSFARIIITKAKEELGDTDVGHSVINSGFGDSGRDHFYQGPFERGSGGHKPKRLHSKEDRDRIKKSIKEFSEAGQRIGEYIIKLREKGLKEKIKQVSSLQELSSEEPELLEDS